MRRRKKEQPAPPPVPPGEKATLGAQRQIDDIRHKLDLGLRAMILAGVVFIIGAAATAWQIDNAFDSVGEERDARITAVSKFSFELRQGLVISCEKNGNPLREAVAGVLEEEIRQQRPEVLERFFPSVPPAVLEATIKKSINHKQELTGWISSMVCKALYPPVPPPPDSPKRLHVDE